MSAKKVITTPEAPTMSDRPHLPEAVHLAAYHAHRTPAAMYSILAENHTEDALSDVTKVAGS